jgi:hypothetical protein
MGNLIPNEPLIYERVNGTVYARYSNRPDIPRWIIGGNDTATLTCSDWTDIIKMSHDNTAIKSQLDKLLTLYYLIKNEKDQ